MQTDINKRLSLKISIPKKVEFVIKKLKSAGFQAFIVGGCIRDILRNVAPEDWDVTTNAAPLEIKKIFAKSFYDNKFGTVTILTDSKKENLRKIEITTYRTESKYSDKRHPDIVKWAKTIQEDLERRDFTVNAMAMEIKNEKGKTKNEIIDLFGGQKDLKDEIIRAVGDPEKRFSEDALRMMRAVRFATTLNPHKIWQIEQKTEKAIEKNAKLLSFISKERIRDEFVKIIMSPNCARGIEILRRLGLLKYIVPELEEGFGIWQNKHHIYQIYQHNLLSLNYACRKKFSKEVRIAALLHDIAKPRTKQGEGLNSTFYNHDIIGAKMTQQILSRLKFPRKEIEKIKTLVKYHLFYYNVGEVGDSSVRRLLRKVGKENIDELLQLRMADRIGSGVPKALPYKLRYLKYKFERLSQDPISTKMLKINGNDIMKILNLKPGPKIGKILTCLLSQILNNPKKNKKAILEKEVKRLGSLSEKELEAFFQKSKKEIESIETKKDQMAKKKYWLS